MLKARVFNQLTLNVKRGSITKTSKNKQKLLDEVNWFRNLPLELRNLTPMIMDVKETKEDFSYEMELFGYPNLAEILLEENNTLSFWKKILKDLFLIHKRFEKYKRLADCSELREIYFSKTQKRLQDIQSYHPEIFEMMKDDKIVINGQIFRNLKLFDNDLYQAIDKLLSNECFTITHGDYCFSNILYDLKYHTFKLVDPRGRFRTQSIYGDPRYDIAKLRHSIVGLYDFIIAERYTIEEIEKNKYEFHVQIPDFLNDLGKIFDNLTVQNGYKLEEIKLIEALLFLTMIPLHSDDVNRQKAFYLIAVQKINNILYGETHENLY